VVTEIQPSAAAHGPSGRRVIIVGAGFGGLGMARAMKHAGIPFTVLEKAPGVGGTWWHNRYPGLKCDVPTLVYRYPYEPLPDTSPTMTETQPELQARAERLCDDNGLRPHIRFGATVVKAVWTDTRWVLTLAGGDTVEGEVLVFSTGFLHNPHIPEIAGRASFKGPVMHSSAWDPGVAIDGKRVAVVGSGSTGCQLVTALAGRASRTLMFARNPQWIVPMPESTMPRWLTTLFNRFRRLDGWVYDAMAESNAKFFAAGYARDGVERKLLAYLCQRNLATVKDPALRAALTPKDPPLCKRPVMSTTFYPAIQRGDVQLVTERIAAITEDGIRTDDGVEHALDVIVLATGYKAQAYMRPIEVVGEGGVTIDQAWAGSPYGYHSLTVPGFPNMLMTTGPLSPRLHVGFHECVDLASRYVKSFVRALEAEDAISMAPSREATTAWVDEVRDAARQSTLGGCASWYQGADGVPLVFTLSRERWQRDTGHFEIKDYVVRRRAAPPATR
jgi:cation diffusion facilitator CzcD-associated flavoprotein CzcO